MARIKYRSAEVSEKRRRFAKKMTIIVVLFLVLIVAGLIFLLRMESIQIRDKAIEGINMISNEEVQNVINDSLSGNYVWVIPKSNTFLYSVKKLNKILIKKFPEILTLDVSRIGLKGISIKIEERKPEALWCKNNQSEDAPECYFVDNTGKVFARAPFFSGNVYFVYKGGLSNEDFLGTQLFNTQDFVNFSSFVKQVSNRLDVKIISAEIKDQGDFDLYLSSGTRIMLNKNISYDDMFNNMEAVLKSAQFSTSTLGSLDYIDMRFGNKVYYKAKSAPKL